MNKTTHLMLAVCAWALAGAAFARTPVLVELFTAQGCASCGEADALVAKLADRSGVIALTWSVDYWDYLGWKDTFARPEFTDRQRGYDRRFGLRDVYTPQVVIDGAAQTSGDNSAKVESLISDSRKRTSAGPKIRILADGHVIIGAAHRPPGGCEVWLIRYDPREQTIGVTDGDNRGRTVASRNVVREYVRLGSWRGARVTLKTPAPNDDGLASLVVVQGAREGRILALMKRSGG